MAAPPIISAARGADVETLRRLLAEGYSPNAIEWTGEDFETQRTPLHVLCTSCDDMSGHVACFKLLRDAGANLGATDSLGYTPLHYSALHGNSEMVSLLIQAGVNVNATNRDGFTPLHETTSRLSYVKSNVDCADLLLKAGAAVNLKTHDYSTPLDVALMRGNRRIVPVFLRAGAEFRYSNLNAYTLRVRDAGGLTRYEQPHLGFEKYAQNHLARITAILAPTPLLPPELVRKILEFWLHAGYY